MRNALVISPFASVPLDAGRRRRVYQTTRLLADAGFRVTLLLLACEEGWRVRHQEEDCERLREQWGEVIVVYGDPKIGLPPRNGDRHNLDEWWDFNLEHTLRNILSRRFFDICLVHQAWLSRTFDLIDGITTKILDLHDIAWTRWEILAAAGVAPAGLLPDEPSELFGIERADIVLTASEPDAANLARRITKKIINLPFYDQALEAETRPARSPRYGDPEKVRFGFLGNGDVTDATNMNAMLAALQAVIGTMASSAEIVVGGGLCEQAQTQLPIRRVARIASVAQFHREVDYAVVPQFVAPGLDTRVADALALGVPVLASRQAAIGLRLNASLVSDSAEAMASRIVEISLSRPPLSNAQAAQRDARDNLRSRAAAGAAKLLDAIARATEPMIIDLSGADPQIHCLVLQSYLSSIRVLSGHCSILLVLPPDLMPHVAPFLPLAVKPITSERLPSALEGLGGRAMLVDVFGTAPSGETASEAPCRRVRDLRWSPLTPPANLDEATLALVPFFHSNIDREPAALELRRRWARDNAAVFGDGSPPTRFVFVEDHAGAVDLGGAADQLRARIIPLADEAAFRAAAMLLLERAGPVEVAWLARGHEHNHRLLVQLCGLRDIPLWAMLDSACFASGQLPPRITAEFDRACEHQLGLLSRRAGSARSSGARPPMA